MVVIDPPPPARSVVPRFVTLPISTTLVRIFNPTRFATTALTFRANGPRARFDHHNGSVPDRHPRDDPQRSMYYAAWSNDLAEALSSSVVEVFGDTGKVILEDFVVALPTTIRAVQLLDLRGRSAMRAGTVAAIAKCPHGLSQPWSRYFYEHPDVYGTMAGLLYLNAHNDEPAVMLYDRAGDALHCPDRQIIELRDERLRHLLIDIIEANNLTL